MSTLYLSLSSKTRIGHVSLDMFPLITGPMFYFLLYSQPEIFLVESRKFRGFSQEGKAYYELLTFDETTILNCHFSFFSFIKCVLFFLLAHWMKIFILTFQKTAHYLVQIVECFLTRDVLGCTLDLRKEFALHDGESGSSWTVWLWWVSLRQHPEPSVDLRWFFHLALDHSFFFFLNIYLFGCARS